MAGKSPSPSAKQVAVVSSLRAAALEAAKEADALSGMHQHSGGKFASAKEAKAAKIEAAKAKREAKAASDTGRKS